MFFLLDFFNYDPWAGRAEKSESAERRENRARREFDALRKWVEAAWISYKKRIIRLGFNDFHSPLSLLPEDCLEHIIGYWGAAGTQEQSPFLLRSPGVDSSLIPANEKRGAAALETKRTEPVQSIDSLYEAGRKHVLPLLQPDCHLTGPCWRDFSRHVRNFPGWTAKRIAATPQEKRKFHQTRQGKVYFVQVIFTVPGKPKPKKKARKKRGKPAAVPIPAVLSPTTSVVPQAAAAPPVAAATASSFHPRSGVATVTQATHPYPLLGDDVNSTAPLVVPPPFGIPPPPHSVPYAASMHPFQMQLGLLPTTPSNAVYNPMSYNPMFANALDPSDPEMARRMEVARLAANYVLPEDSKPPAKKKAKRS